LVFLEEQGVECVAVPSWIPYEIASVFQREYALEMRHPSLYPERTIKSAFEIEEIKKAQIAVEHAVKKAMDFLRDCTIHDLHIVTNDRYYGLTTVVTSEMLRSVIDNSLWEQGYKPDHTIVACGLQAADPHCMGFGPLSPYQPIVMDVFPMSRTTHIFSDMTRTVFKGQPSHELVRVYETVLGSQCGAIKQVRPGVNGKDIMEWVVRYLDASGYPTTKGDTPEGFIHGVGHSFGIEIHEPPYINRQSHVLHAGNVVTVEPGLYYSRPRDHIPAAGIRIEDAVLVTKDGCENLTKFPKDLASMIIA
ncbi:MAG: Xaa-Pro peptidase family protein, partial [Candidatus Sungbacteria bacterium]|nr:Xaa-Pro peptidase family protein [Candidatus Sungbacteria bacterium]